MAFNVPRPGDPQREWYNGEEATWWQLRSSQTYGPSPSVYGNEGTSPFTSPVGSFPVLKKEISDFIGEGEYSLLRDIPNSLSRTARLRSIYIPPGTRLVISTDMNFSDDSYRHMDVVGPALIYGFSSGKRNTKNSWRSGQHRSNSALATYAKFGKYTDCVGVGYDSNCWAVNIPWMVDTAVWNGGMAFKITYDQNPRTPFFKDLGVPSDAPPDFTHMQKRAFTYADMMTVLGNYPERGVTKTGIEYYNYWSDDRNQDALLMAFSGIGWHGMHWKYLT